MSEQEEETTTQQPNAKHQEELSNWPFVRRIAFMAVAVILLVYVAWWTALYNLQDSLIFPTDALPPVAGETRFPNTQVLELTQPTGELSRAWLVLNPEGSADNPLPLVVFFHGNQELIDYQDEVVGLYISLGAHVLLPEYRGYGRSGGSPSREGIVDDCSDFVSQAIARDDVDRERVVFHGRSLGGAVAAETALKVKPSVLILQSTFTSTTDMAKQFAAPEFLIRHRFDTKTAVAELNIPTLIFHGKQDNVVPIEHAFALRDAASKSQFIAFDADHNSFPGAKNARAYIAAVATFLLQTGISDEPKSSAKPKAGNQSLDVNSSDSTPQSGNPSTTQPTSQPVDVPTSQPANLAK